MTPSWFVSRAARWALALWLLLAVVVFNVTFDWKTRMAGPVFIGSQIARQRQGLPVQTINDGFRPMVRQSAIDAAKWLVLIAVSGAGLVAVASKRQKLNA